MEKEGQYEGMAGSKMTGQEETEKHTLQSIK